MLGDGTPKYLNSPDSVVFNKSRNLFALNLAKNTKLGRIILTEGYMDTISLYQSGFDCAVASLGTALTVDHAKLLSRFTKEVVICYDADSAGIQAANRAIPMLEKTGLKVRVLRVTGAKDPDEFLKKYGPDAFARLLDQSENYVEYNLRQLQSNYDLSDPVQKNRVCSGGCGDLGPVRQPGRAGGLCAGSSLRSPGSGSLPCCKRSSGSAIFACEPPRKSRRRREMIPVNQIQPKNRQLRYENPRSARAEEGILRLLMLDGSFVSQTQGLEPSQFSSPVLGKIYGILLGHLSQGRSLQLGALEGELEGEEITLLAHILGQPVAMEHSAAAMIDYRAVIEREAMRRQNTNDEAVLLAARDTYRKKKSISQGDG